MGNFKAGFWGKYVTVLLVLSLLLIALVACKSEPAPMPTPNPGPSGGTIVRSDSVITGEIKAIRRMSSSYPWEVDILVQDSQNVDSLVNPTKDKVGEVITTVTDQDMKPFNGGQVITAHVKLTGDVEHGISLYIYDIKVQ